jgi:UDP-sugar pyrophosphorylase
VKVKEEAVVCEVLKEDVVAEVAETPPAVVEEVAKEEAANEETTKTAKEDTAKEETDSVTYPFTHFLPSMTPAQVTLATALFDDGQGHLFSHWVPGVDDDKKKAVLSQLETLHATYPLPNGLLDYTANARKLLKTSKAGANPLEGWVPEVPKGVSLSLSPADKSSYNTYEDVGLSKLSKTGYVLVAGGLGERLGYSDIKLNLPTELCSMVNYLEYYIATILSVQRKCCDGNSLELCIMVSDDTHDKTIKLLNDNNYYGMEKDNVIIVKQEKVAAISSNDGHIALTEEKGYEIDSKPHGHGDVHSLLHSKGVAKQWLDKGVEYIVFFQDTNGLGFHTLAASLGVSIKLDLVMNSIAIPRKAKQAVGAICLLKKGDEERTINVEYNQLDPLLRDTVCKDGDINDETTGYSAYPGNINQLIFKNKEYCEALSETCGVMAEFVNPKYADDAKEVFKKPTRLECMMQDYPLVLKGDYAKRVGFTSVPAEMCFSPVKNAVADGAKAQKSGTAPAVAASGEADHYGAVKNIMRMYGCDITDGDNVTFNDITVCSGPKLVVMPEVCCCPNDYATLLPNGGEVKISGKSSLVVKGKGKVVIESLDLDGALVIDTGDNSALTVTVKNAVVKNGGWVHKELKKDDAPEYLKMRGYDLEKTETCTFTAKEGAENGYEVSKDYEEVAAAAPAAAVEEVAVVAAKAEDVVVENVEEKKAEEEKAAAAPTTSATKEEDAQEGTRAGTETEGAEKAVEVVGTGEANECGCSIM